MTSSLPNLDASKSELDKLSDRLGKLKPMTSRLPKPEISPKPAHLVAQLAKPKIPSPKNAVQTSPKNQSENNASNSSSTNTSPGTASMLKSTLKRITKLTTSPVSRSQSFREPIPPPRILQNKPNGHPTSMTRSSSLRRVKNKDLANNKEIHGNSTLNYPLSRSGTSGTLDRNGVKRTPSMTSVRRFRDRDLNVKLSRGIQTQLTKDTVDEPDFNDDGSIPTNIDFTVYLPDLFGGDTDQVETHVSEPTEPVDVRKNRQLTLDNMKLHRELEKLKQGASEYDLVKKELRTVKAKLEEEQKLRTKMEHQLDMHNKKVKEIADSMDCVEREFEKRDATIYDLEGQVKVEKGKVEHLESELQKSSKIIESHRSELSAARKTQKTLVEQCDHIEDESRELQEFLQIEKMALSETLKDAECEIEKLKETITSKDLEVKEAEERCGHLVRLGEQRHQELLTSQQQLKTFSDMAKDIMINQGTELYQISHKLRNLTSKLTGTSLQSSETKEPQIIKQEIENMFHQLESEPKNDTNVTDSLQNLSLAIEKRRKSESLIANGKNCENEDKIHEQMEQLDQLVESFIKDHDRNSDQNDQNDKNQINIDDSMNKSILNGETMEEMRAKFMKHQQIYKTNYELAETEIKRMDELYQDLIENVLKTFKTIPEVVTAQPDLQRLKEMLESESSLSSPANGFGSKKVSMENSFKTVQEDNLSL